MKDILEGFQTISRTEETKENYILRSEQLIKKFIKEVNYSNSSVNLDIRQLTIWLIEKKSTISRSTWRQYKSSIIYYLENYDDKLAANDCLDKLRHETSIGALKKTEKTSSLKLKKITFSDWLKIDAFLSEKNKKWHAHLKVWLRSSIITGLRPVEWKNASLFNHSEGLALKLKNAKNTNGRAHGEDRTLLLKNLSEEDIKCIKIHLNNVRTYKGMDQYSYFYRGCALALYNACRECWPRRKRHITLYSTRHQFSSNAKSSGFSKSEVAAMMGHAIDLTASIHYGKKLAGNEKLGINPLSDDVSRVKSTNQGPFKPKNKDILSDLIDNSLTNIGDIK